MRNSIKLQTLVVALIAGFALVGCSHSRAVHAAPTVVAVAPAPMVEVDELSVACIPGSGADCNLLEGASLSDLGMRLTAGPLVQDQEALAAR